MFALARDDDATATTAFEIQLTDCNAPRRTPVAGKFSSGKIYLLAAGSVCLQLSSLLFVITTVTTSARLL